MFCATPSLRSKARLIQPYQSLLNISFSGCILWSSLILNSIANPKTNFTEAIVQGSGSGDSRVVVFCLPVEGA